MDIENMSVRELQKAVKELEQALQERDRVLQEKADIEKALDDEKKTNTQLTKERDSLKTKAGNLQNSKQALEKAFEDITWSMKSSKKRQVTRASKG
jgi:predicted nuclease with TOPRIM domain